MTQILQADLNPQKISVVIRTLNEETYLDELLSSIRKQQLPEGWSCEVVLVDSGSTDRTLEIARQHQCKIATINKSEFSFGKSLNIGCQNSEGSVLVFVSGHCVPCENTWLEALTAPIREGLCGYTYGRQLGRGPTKFSESRVFLKYYSIDNLVPQEGFFANNANAALHSKLWREYGFDEQLTGLEDMHLAKRLVESGVPIGYVADAGVYHIHDESWRQIANRFEREGAALTEIMPETGLTLVDFFECTLRSIAKDSYAAIKQGLLLRNFIDICCYRTLQYWGSYRGTRFARMVASMRRKTYFHPDKHFTKQPPGSRKTQRSTAEPASYRSES